MYLFGKSKSLQYGIDLHVGEGARLWAPKSLLIGNSVYIGKHVHIEANCEIGGYCLIANRIAIIGRHDHDFSRQSIRDYGLKFEWTTAVLALFNFYEYYM